MALIQRRPRWGLQAWPNLMDWEGWDEDFFGTTMAVDMYEDQDKVVVKTDLPGVQEHEVDITITGDQVTITAEHREEEEEKRKDYLRRERRAKSYARTLSLPCPVLAEKAEARFEDGTLTLTIPKAEEAKPKQIKIKATK